jgi:hypothetical protein
MYILYLIVTGMVLEVNYRPRKRKNSRVLDTLPASPDPPDSVRKSEEIQVPPPPLLVGGMTITIKIRAPMAMLITTTKAIVILGRHMLTWP